MSNCNCNTNNELAELKDQFAEIKNQLDQVLENTKAFNGGHPIFAIQNADDIECFNMDLGYGSGKWEGWALADGRTYVSPITGKNIVAPELLDKFLIGAGDDFEVNDTGGSQTVTLTEEQIPAHNHAVTDPGHVHDIQDPGHTHGATSGSHTHTITTAPHSHTISGDGAHTHVIDDPMVASVDYNSGTGPFRTAFGYEGSGTNIAGLTTPSGGQHSHTPSNTTVSATASSEVVGVTVSEVTTGIGGTEEATTGITTQYTGGGEAHDNMPPYYCVIYVFKL